MKKINFRLSLTLWIAFFVIGNIAIVEPTFLQKAQLVYWQKVWGSLAFLLLGFNGFIWMITGEMKKTANLTYRGKSVIAIGVFTLLFCLFFITKLLLR
ncbi:MAG: hypothetical protein QM730_12700 [Anaerolineales bacterium]